ncbi:MAG: 30S ribosomal protein S14 [Chloroflexi bacterium]|nr:30S ribosomal protein S14 [Chloroflexota bacterium]MCY3696185.1 30S ribosomal protein S14 [Chloroflexota bacterium]MXX31576.1 30S ribosomal protein S14 [Chloroflexota bacterium]MYB22570.1 30S ribosomal protein S14 [Chloroflexota bacterium]MYD16739.1 30S ribosomal protein S14 [Chloroflexota bacterium]
MARTSNIHRDLKRRKMHDKYKSRRESLKQQLKESNNPREKQNLQFQLQALPRNSSPTRLKNRCAVTGRPRAYMRKFGLSRITFREMASLGLLPGVRKSSW